MDRYEYFTNAKMYYFYFNAMYNKTHNIFYFYSAQHFYDIAKEYGTISSLELTDSEKEMVNKLLTCNS